MTEKKCPRNGKVCYTTYRAAQKALERIIERKNPYGRPSGVCLTIYRCGTGKNQKKGGGCGYFHIGNSKVRTDPYSRKTKYPKFREKICR